VRLAHPPRDQLRVLRSVVDDEDEIGLHGGSLRAVQASLPERTRPTEEFGHR
jgi:hypothetical protein